MSPLFRKRKKPNLADTQPSRWRFLDNPPQDPAFDPNNYYPPEFVNPFPGEEVWTGQEPFNDPLSQTHPSPAAPGRPTSSGQPTSPGLPTSNGQQTGSTRPSPAYGHLPETQPFDYFPQPAQAPVNYQPAAQPNPPVFPQQYPQQPVYTPEPVYQPLPQPVYRDPQYDPYGAPRFEPLAPRRRSRGIGCLLVGVLLLGLVPVLLAYFLAPVRTNILLLGIDARPTEGDAGRSDTMILTTILPLKPYVGMLSIPRDLWVQVPGHGENRINTAHFYGELDQPGSGPEAAIQAVQQNFGVTVSEYVRVRFDGFKDVVDALGGVDVTFPQDMSGFTAGTHHLTGEQALALVRDRQSSDDFFRMQRGQLFLKSVWKEMAKPASWPKLPAVFAALSKAVDTNVPVWQWPRLGVAILRAGPDGIDYRTITREMTNPFTTSAGAQVLGPNWELINPVLLEMFGQ